MSQISTRIPEEEKDRISIFAKDHDMKLSQVVRWAIREYLDRHENKREENEDE